MLNLVLLMATVGLVALASLGEKHWGWRVAAYAGMVLLGIGGLLLALIYLMAALMQRAAPQAMSPDLAGALGGLDPLRVGLGLLAGTVLSWAALLPPVRRLAARVVPLRPESAVNAVALALLVLLWAQSLALSGLTPQGFVAIAGSLSLEQVVLGEVPLALLGIVGVGFLTRRNARETLQRLGLQRLTWRQLALCVVGVIGLIAFELAANLVTSWVAPQAFDELNQATTQLYAGVNTVWAAVLVAVASGTAEEILFRGALQPRFGLVLTALSFGVVHMQYGVTWALLSLGLVGLLLGLYRQRINTTACIVVHGLYNLVLFLLPR